MTTSQDDIKQVPSGGTSPKEAVPELSEWQPNAISADASSTTEIRPRTLSYRQVAVYAMAGSMGTNVFMQGSSGLIRGGPISLLIGYIYMATILAAVNIGQAEMVSWRPITSNFNRLASVYVDRSTGVASSVNYLVLMASLVCFEITAGTAVLSYWTAADLDIAIPFAFLGAYCALNIWSTKFFGEGEFWIGIIKIITITGLLISTIFFMSGANPQRDSFGFRYWLNPGPMNEWQATGSTGRFLGVIAGLVNAAWAFQGPDMVGMISCDAKNPRVTVPKIYKTVWIRLSVFFVGSALGIGIMTPHDDPILIAAVANSAPGAARSAWVRGMDRLDIPVLPHIINAVIFTSVFSAGNAYVYAGARTIYGLAAEGTFPKIFARTNRNGVPYVGVISMLLIGLLSFLQVSTNSSVALGYFVDVSTAALLVTWVIMSVTHIRFRQAIRAQGFDHSQLPYWSRKFGGWAGWYGVVNATLVLIVSGYMNWIPGNFDSTNFILAYFALFFTVAVYLGHKIFTRNPWRKAVEVDLYYGADELAAADLAEMHAEADPEKAEVESQGKLARRVPASLRKAAKKFEGVL